MQDNEWKEIWQDELNIFSGILFNNSKFAKGTEDIIFYDFDCIEYDILKKQYGIQNIAGDGTAFEKAIRLTQYFAVRLTHNGNFNNSINCNAIDLLKYSLNNPSCGINCVNKSKILQECCLALGIYARRVWLMPYSPYDEDNHVVTEIYDDKLQKWIMIDVSSNGYFVDDSGMPLSVLEIRRRFAMKEWCNFTKTISEYNKVFSDLEAETLYYNRYFAKNSFYYYVEQINTFGNKNAHLLFIPEGFNENKWTEQNLNYKLNAFPNNRNLIEQLEKLKMSPSKRICDLSVLIAKP